jgi:type I restriction enzyme M protein
MAGNGNGANLGFEQKLWQTADKMRSNMDAAGYKHVAVGLIFLKYIPDAFEERRQALSKEEGGNSEERDEYTVENVLRVPQQARWEFFQKNAKQVTISRLLDDAMIAIEKDNGSGRKSGSP